MACIWPRHSPCDSAQQISFLFPLGYVWPDFPEAELACLQGFDVSLHPKCPTIGEKAEPVSRVTTFMHKRACAAAYLAQ